ncbi:EF-hand domain-containing protein [Flavobacterium pectinovorum]|uniref:EF-hand domain-containing protein n=1 Tax=Flavobacterium pectinovorum TaxID=29533 RepID=A0A502F3M9_9FLAO|nr:EF-hand domain-containing protein [Flavobacterium pectinovorum]TPG44457.1 EF-hand domain-containing protein [Flavobacterium pectinovorum]
MKNVKKNVCVTVVGTLLLVLSSSFSYGNNLKQNSRPYDLIFQLLDLNHSGYLEGNELAPLTSLLNVTTDVVPILISLADENHDGKVSENEFTIAGGVQGILDLYRTYFPN